MSKTQISNIIQSGGFLGRLLGPLRKTGLPSMKNLIKSLDKRILIPSGLTAAALALAVADTGIHKKILGSDRPSSSASHNNRILIISNDEIKDIIKIVKSLEDSSLLQQGNSKTIQNEAKKQRGGFLSMLLGTLGASSSGNILTGKGINRAKEGIVRAGYGDKRGQKTRTKRQYYEKKMDF